MPTPGSDNLSAAVERNLTRYFAGFRDGLPPPGLYHRILREIEYPLLSAALAATRGNQIRAADLLGRQPQHPAQEDPRPRYPGDPDQQLIDGSANTAPACRAGLPPELSQLRNIVV